MRNIIKAVGIITVITILQGCAAPVTVPTGDFNKIMNLAEGQRVDYMANGWSGKGWKSYLLITDSKLQVINWAGAGPIGSSTVRGAEVSFSDIDSVVVGVNDRYMGSPLGVFIKSRSRGVNVIEFVPGPIYENIGGNNFIDMEEVRGEKYKNSAETLARIIRARMDIVVPLE